MTHPVIPMLVIAALAAAPAAEAQSPIETMRTVIRTVSRTQAAESVRRVQRERLREEQTERISRTLKTGASGEIDLSNIAGNIIVKRGSGNEATIDIVKTARAQSVEDAKRLLAEVQVEITDRNGRADVKTRYPSEQQRGRRNMGGVSVAYTVSAPAATRFRVQTISGDVTVGDITGELSLESISGAITVTGASRITAAKSISGDVTISDAALEVSAEAGSVSGTVTVRQVRATRLNLNSISGNIVVRDTTAERATAGTMSGDVEFNSTLSRNGRYELKSHSGDIRVTVMGSTGFELEASSWSGSLRADIPGLSQAGDTPGRSRRESIRGTFGDGSAVLSVTTFSGNAVISRR